MGQLCTNSSVCQQAYRMVVGGSKGVAFIIPALFEKNAQLRNQIHLTQHTGIALFMVKQKENKNNLQCQGSN